MISWSKAQSKTVAMALHSWLPSVIPGIKPWISTNDIDKGRQWFSELQTILTDTRLCIVCVTPDNVRSPWIYYEVGAIATKEDVLICPYLVGVTPNMLADGPLGKWQCTIPDEDDTWDLIKSLNKNALANSHELTILESNYRARWRDFYAMIEPVLTADADLTEGFVETAADHLAGVNLSAEARTLLIEGSKDKNGKVWYSRTSSGTHFQTNGQKLCTDQSPRSVAKWKAGLDTLVDYGLLEGRGYKGELFGVTAQGFEVADILQGAKTP